MWPDRPACPRSGCHALSTLWLSDLASRAVALQADVSDPAACAPLVDCAVDALGWLDVLVSNAGVEHFGTLASITAPGL